MEGWPLAWPRSQSLQPPSFCSQHHLQPPSARSLRRLQPRSWGSHTWRPPVCSGSRPTPVLATRSLPHFLGLLLSPRWKPAYPVPLWMSPAWYPTVSHLFGGWIPARTPAQLGPWNLTDDIAFWGRLMNPWAWKGESYFPVWLWITMMFLSVNINNRRHSWQESRAGSSSQPHSRIQ